MSSHGGTGEADSEYQSQTSQTEQEKREVRKKIRNIRDRLQQSREDGNEVFGEMLEEAKMVLPGVKGTQEMIEDANMFHLMSGCCGYFTFVVHSWSVSQRKS